MTLEPVDATGSPRVHRGRLWHLYSILEYPALKILPPANSGDEIEL